MSLAYRILARRLRAAGARAPTRWPVRRAPSPPGDPILGHLRPILRDRLGFMTRSFERYGDVVRVHVLGGQAQLFAHPDHVEEILVRKHRLYTKNTPGYRWMREFLGEGLLTSEGAVWRRHRRIAQPAFHRRRIEAFAATMTRAGEALLATWDEAADTGRPRDIAVDLSAVTLRIAGETLLSTDPSAEAREVRRALDVVLHGFNERSSRPLMLPLAVPTPYNLKLRAAARSLDRVVLGIIERRRRSGAAPDDLLQMLLEARDEDGSGMDDRQLRDEVMTLLLAGHETTANMLAWTLYLLSRAPEHARRVAGEAHDVLGDRPPTVDDLPRLPHGRRVLHEALRLYPPAWIFGRSPSADDEVGGYPVPAGSIVFLSPFVTHRHPGFWRDPEGFDPDRWRPERAAGHHRTQFFPFAAGPRMCIGAGFALMEGQLLLPMLLRRFRFALRPGHPVEPEPLITLRPKHGIRMTVHRREL
ncbi:MAG: cytochrome P450 [Sandaracinaceae bacterium]